MARLRRVVIERLIRYYRYLMERTSRQSVERITSGQLGSALEVDPSQVRKDFASVGLVGMSRVGYDVGEICRVIPGALGFDRTYDAVLIGVGHLGGALLAYRGFEQYGLRIVAAFDAARDKVGRRIADHTILSVHRLKSFIEEHAIPAAIIATPVEVAQGVADLVVLAGARAVWNFTPTRLSVPPGVLARNEHISMGMAQIAYHLKSLQLLEPFDGTGGEPGNGDRRKTHPKRGRKAPAMVRADVSTAPRRSRQSTRRKPAPRSKTDSKRRITDAGRSGGTARDVRLDHS